MDQTLCDRDYYLWLTETAYLLQEGRLSELDILNLRDEIESMGKSQKRAVKSYLKVITRFYGLLFDSGIYPQSHFLRTAMVYEGR